MTTVAILGLGEMGRRMALRVAAAKHEVFGWNRSPVADIDSSMGIEMMSTPAEAAARAEVVLSMLTDDDASRAVWCTPKTGALATLRNGSLAIDSSTVTPAWARELAHLVTASGSQFLDAPVVGSRPQAEAGKLGFLLGGEASALARAEPILKEMGSAFHLLGPHGSGATLKLSINAMLGAQVATLAEQLGVMRAAGLDLAKAVAVYQSLPVASPSLIGYSNLMVAKKYDPVFTIALAAKDFRYAVELASQLDQEIPATETVSDILEYALEHGLGGENLNALAKLYE